MAIRPLKELVNNDHRLFAIEEPRIIEFKDEEEKKQQIRDRSYGDSVAYRLGEKRRVVGGTTTSWLQTVQYYAKKR
jgi:hypothetical protein